jgi:hypothetical protein
MYGGLMDEVSIYSRALSSAEIQAIYLSGSAGKCTNSSAPEILVQPPSQTFFQGDTATIPVIALGTPPLQYQWTFGGTPIAGATGSSLVLTNVQFAQNGVYAVTVSNALGSALSSNAVLSVNSRCASPPSGLVSWWQGEGNANDQTGSNNGTVQGGTSFNKGLVNQAFNFDGTSGYVLVPDSTSLDFTNAMTFEAWIYPRSSGDHHHEIVSKWEGGVNQYSYTFTIVPDGRFAAGLGSDGTASSLISAFSLSTIPLFTWSHVAAVYDGSALSIYVNGIFNSAVPWTRGIFPGTAPLVIGSTLTSGSFFNGLIDEVSLYQRALPASEIQAIYKAGADGKCVSPTAPVITSQPSDQTVIAGSTASLGVVASGTQPLFYQWSFNGVPIAGATAQSLTLTAVQLNQAGTYAVAVTNSIGFAISSNAVLTRRPGSTLPQPTRGIGKLVAG